MCRPKYLADGTLDPSWRRCPAHSDPLRISQRNERRRATYQAKVIADTNPYVHTTIDPKKIEIIRSMQTPLSTGVISGKVGEELIHDTEDSYFNKELNITRGSQMGYLVEEGLFDKTTLTGVINYNNLNESSWKELGFHDSSQPFMQVFHGTLINEESKLEGANLTDAEREALWFYSKQNFTWINSSLYNRSEGLHNYVAPDFPDDKPYFSQDNRTDSNSTETSLKPIDKLESHLRTPRMIKEVTALLDSALVKGPRKQRTVYRGMGWTNGRFVDKSQNYIDTNDTGRVARWVKENFILGEEILMDGYQSASIDPSIGAEYAGTNGVMFEIKTASGMNVTANSRFSFEREVLLPRNSRYMVVGIHYDQTLKTIDTATKYNTTIVQLIEINDDGSIVSDGNMPEIKPLRQLTVTPHGEPEEAVVANW